MTYLEIVNNVLKRLRERTVSTVEENTYSTLIGLLVNDAKREVEDAWSWSALRTTITTPTVAGTASYSLTGSGDRQTTLVVMNDTDNNELVYQTQTWFNKRYELAGTEVSGSPRYYTFDGVDSNGDTVIKLYPKPDAVYSILYKAVVRPTDFTDDSDTVSVPVQPIRLLAYAKAIEERGEDGGVMSSSAYMAAQRALADSVALDAIRHPEELIWEAYDG